MKIVIPHRSRKNKEMRSIELIDKILSNADCNILKKVRIKGKETKTEAEKLLDNGKIYIKTSKSSKTDKYALNIYFNSEGHLKSSSEEVREFVEVYVTPMILRYRELSKRILRKTGLKTRRKNQKIRKYERMGFRTEEEYLLYKGLKEFEPKHNLRILGTEVDLFIEPNLIIEVGYLLEHWKYDLFEKNGYRLLYFANMEIRNKELLRNVISTVKRTMKETGCFKMCRD